MLKINWDKSEKKFEGFGKKIWELKKKIPSNLKYFNGNFKKILQDFQKNLKIILLLSSSWSNFKRILWNADTEESLEKFCETQVLICIWIKRNAYQFWNIDG